MKVGEKLGVYVREHGIMNKFLAEKVGVTDSKMSFILNGRQEITPIELYRACKALDVPMEQFCEE
jgi:plasmid maintenance system antidote protein VapI